MQFFLPFNSRFLDVDGQKLSENLALPPCHVHPTHITQGQKTAHYIISKPLLLISTDHGVIL
jgi:hypothetical protein